MVGDEKYGEGRAIARARLTTAGARSGTFLSKSLKKSRDFYNIN